MVSANRRKYHGNQKVFIPLNQRLALTRAKKFTEIRAARAAKIKIYDAVVNVNTIKQQYHWLKEEK